MTTAERGRRAPAWRGGFGRLWSAAVLSSFGDALRTAALPLLAVTLTDRPLLVASVTACGYLPWLVFGLFGGAVADRVDQRRAMWTVERYEAAGRVLRGGRGLGHASIGLLIALAFTLTTLQTLFDNAATALLPPWWTGGPRQRERPADDRPADRGRTGGRAARAGAARRGSRRPLRGRRPHLPGRRRPWSPRSAPTAPEREPDRRAAPCAAEIAAGLRTLWRDRALRGLCAATALCNIGMGALIATLVLLVTGWLDAGNAGYAAVMTAYTVGQPGRGRAERSARRPGRAGACRAARRWGADRGAGRDGLGAQPDRAGVEPGRVRAMGMVWNVNTTTLMQQPLSRRDARPGQLRLPHAGGRRGAAGRTAGRSRRDGMGSEHAGVARRCLLRPVGRRADTGAEGGRICCWSRRR